MNQRNTGIKISSWLLVLAGMLFPLISFAQKSLEIGPAGGIAYYNGDITPGKPFVQPKPAFGILARYNVDNRWAVKVSITHGSLAGSDSISKAVTNRNLSFNSTVNELAVTGEFNFWNYFTGSKREIFTPYLMGGGSFFIYDSQLSVGNSTVPTYKSNSFALIFGMGLKYSLSKKLGVGVEWGMRKTFTDYLDGVGTYIPNSSQQIQVGNNYKDWYNFTLVSLTYKIDLESGMNCNGLKW
ncbi:MAG: outer membrane beta-barrel protein [Bacteroidales bacterium]|nr:outer membrane beta-barrel protein [Bacteroidales bacterium]